MPASRPALARLLFCWLGHAPRLLRSQVFRRGKMYEWHGHRAKIAQLRRMGQKWRKTYARRRICEESGESNNKRSVIKQLAKNYIFIKFKLCAERFGKQNWDRETGYGPKFNQFERLEMSHFVLLRKCCLLSPHLGTVKPWNVLLDFVAIKNYIRMPHFRIICPFPSSFSHKNQM